MLEEAVAQAIEDLDEGISNLRSLVTDLRPVALDDLGLATALEMLCERASRHGLEIDPSIELAYEQGREPTRHTAELETAIYRVIQEALTNASRHGQAKRAVIETRETATTVELIVRDAAPLRPQPQPSIRCAELERPSGRAEQALLTAAVPLHDGRPRSGPP